jgi:4-carboxymuconolactone decarboxylase
MARLPYVDFDSAPKAAAAVGNLPPLNVFRMIANAEDVFPAWMRFAGAVLNSTEVDPRLRQLAVLRVAALSPGCDYMLVQHEGIARAIGMTDAELEAARTGTGLSGDDALILRFAEEVVEDVSPSEDTWQEMGSRFTPRQIVEMLLQIGQYMMVARIAATTQLDIDEPQGNRVAEALR